MILKTTGFFNGKSLELMKSECEVASELLCNGRKAFHDGPNSIDGSKKQIRPRTYLSGTEQALS